MKNRIKMLILAGALSAGMLSGSVYASDAETEAQTEAAAPAADEESADSTQDLKEPAEVTGDGLYASNYALMEQYVEQTLTQLSQLTDEQVEQYKKSSDSATSILINTWDGFRDELGEFTGVNSYTVDEEDDVITFSLDADYAGAEEGTKTTVTYAVDMIGQTSSVNWNVVYPIGRSVREAALNTLLGLGTVFVVLMFLTFLIGQIHWIPDLLEARKKKNQPEEEAPVRQAPVVAAPVEEEEPEDDGELVAVIAAAIAASEQLPVEGFRVRSIRKANRRKWQDA